MIFKSAFRYKTQNDWEDSSEASSIVPFIVRKILFLITDQNSLPESAAWRAACTKTCGALIQASSISEIIIPAKKKPVSLSVQLAQYCKQVAAGTEVG